jgi:hypothetical protein
MKQPIDIKLTEEIELKIEQILGRYPIAPAVSRNKYIEAAYWFFWRWYYFFTSGLFFKCKYAIQRLFRGYDDLDKWNAAWYIARKVIPVLKAMRNELHGTSIKWHREDRFGAIIELTADEVHAMTKSNVWDGPVAFTEAEWRAILDDIIFAFQWQIDGDSPDRVISEEQVKQGFARQKRGLQLFSIYYKNLWD